jgi:hypothetical protein
VGDRGQIGEIDQSSPRQRRAGGAAPTSGWGPGHLPRW